MSARGKPAGQRHRAYRVGDKIRKARIQGSGGFHQGATPVQRHDELRAPKRHCPPITGLHHVVQVSGGARAGFAHVHMGVGAINLENAGMAHHGLGEIGVQIQAHRHRQVVAHQGAQAPEKLALAVLQVLADHGAVKIQIHAVHRQRALEIREQHFRDALDKRGRTTLTLLPVLRTETVRECFRVKVLLHVDCETIEGLHAILIGSAGGDVQVPSAVIGPGGFSRAFCAGETNDESPLLR